MTTTTWNRRTALLILAVALQSSAAQQGVPRNRGELRNQVEGVLAAIGEAAVPPLIEVLNSGDGERRRSAARILAFVDDRDPASVVALTRALQSNDAIVRQLAALGLGRRAEFAGNAVQDLIRQAQGDADQNARRQAILALGSIRQLERETIPVLLAALQSEDAAIREAGFEALQHVESPSETVLFALGKHLGDRAEDPTVRTMAVATLVRYGDKGLSVIEKILKSLPADLRVQVVQQLAVIDVFSPTVEQMLVASLANPDPVVRRNATISLGRISRRSQEADQALTEMLRDDRIDVRSAASRALRRMKGASQVYVVKLLANTEDPTVQLLALQALRHDEVLESLVETITKYLSSKSPEVCQAAIEVLGYLAEKSDQAFRVLRDTATQDNRLAPDAISVLSQLKVRRVDAEAALCQVLVSGEAWRRALVLEAFTAAGAPLTASTRQAVVHLLDDSNLVMAERAARLVVSPGVGWQQGVKAALEHNNAAVRQAAIDSLTDSALAELVAPKELLAYLEGPNARYATLAALALGAQREPSKGVSVALQKTLQSANPELAEASLRALLKLGSLKTDNVLEMIQDPAKAETAIRVLAGLKLEAKQAVVVLIPKLMAGGDLEARLAASELLGRLGKSAVAALRPLLRLDDQVVQELALNATRLNGAAAVEAVPDLIALLDD